MTKQYENIYTTKELYPFYRQAADTCMQLGEKFVCLYETAYTKIALTNDTGINWYICEMQNLYDDVCKVKFAHSDKPVGEKHLYDWFFVVGELPIDIFNSNEDMASCYTDFADYILNWGMDIEQAFSELYNMGVII